MKRLVKIALMTGGLLLLGGCNPSMKPLGYHAQKPYVPMSLMVMPQGSTRYDMQTRNELTEAVKSSGAFSFIDYGFSRKGYALVISEPPGKGAGVLVALNALTIVARQAPPFRAGKDSADGVAVPGCSGVSAATVRCTHRDRMMRSNMATQMPFYGGISLQRLHGHAS